jgi:CyaY protein
MTESEFLSLAESTLNTIEAVLEQTVLSSELDIECSRTGNVLEIEFVDNGSKIIINSQAPMQEIWIAAKSGGFHYKREGRQWINTRDGSELFAALSGMVSEQSGCVLVLNAGSESGN